MSRAQVLPEDAGVNLRQQTTNRENRSERSKSLVFACVVCFARIKSAFEMNNIQREDVTL